MGGAGMYSVAYDSNLLNKLDKMERMKAEASAAANPSSSQQPPPNERTRLTSDTNDGGEATAMPFYFSTVLDTVPPSQPLPTTNGLPSTRLHHHEALEHKGSSSDSINGQAVYAFPPEDDSKDEDEGLPSLPEGGLPIAIPPRASPGIRGGGGSARRGSRKGERDDSRQKKPPRRSG